MVKFVQGFGVSTYLIEHSIKNLGQLWLPYIELQGDFNMLYLIIWKKHFPSQSCSNVLEFNKIVISSKDLGMLWHH